MTTEKLSGKENFRITTESHRPRPNVTNGHDNSTSVILESSSDLEIYTRDAVDKKRIKSNDFGGGASKINGTIPSR